MCRPLYLLIPIFILWTSCSEPDDSISFDPDLNILFSNDSVVFDTLLSDSRSSTRRLTIYNPNKQAIEFSRIQLGKQNTSDYSVIISGKAQNEVINERILGGDSLLVLIEVNVVPKNRNDPYLVKDSLVFNWNTNSEHVKLISWGQDGKRIRNEIPCNITWTNNRPYIISDTVLVQPNCQLVIEPGTQIFLENNATIFIQGTLTAIGDSANHIVFRNTRFDGIYDQIPGQWNGIYFLEGSNNNEIAFAEIFNGRTGLRLGTPDDNDIPDVQVSNTEIYNMSFAGILAFTSDLNAINCLIYNCGTYLTGNFAGGNYTYQHCTFSNDPSLFVQEQPAVQFSDNIEIDNNELLTNDLTFELTNCIVWGSGEEELLISNGGGANINANLTTNIIRSSQELPGNFTSREFNFPGFTNAISFDYSLDSLAFAKGKGTDIGILNDIRNVVRDGMPDIGAFERVEKK